MKSLTRESKRKNAERLKAISKVIGRTDCDIDNVAMSLYDIISKVVVLMVALDGVHPHQSLYQEGMD